MNTCAHDVGPRPLTRRQIRERERATLARISGATAEDSVTTTQLPALTRRQLRELEAARQRRASHTLPRVAIAASLGALTIAAPMMGVLHQDTTPAQAAPIQAGAEPAVHAYADAALNRQTEGLPATPESLRADPLAATRATQITASRTLERAQVQCGDAVQGASGLRAALQDDSEAPIVYPLAKGTYRHTSPYGVRVHPIFGSTIKHEGTDMAAPVGTPIHAVADGTVVHAGNGIQGRSSMLVIIEHEIDGEKVQTWYVHMFRDGVFVSEGQKVTAGEVIGAVGNFGNSTGPHLHFEVHVGPNMHTIDPLPWLTKVGAISPGSC